ncbi:Fur family transcriptional regulator [Marinifilum caeruleilacunae]|uniref:Transcriptional repressor n=1 Tax=Marinifilum caeruleilacunae TaxID=2499076 RepID=A0ABX1WVI7_9BACT|nr:transcriptional repressor [Marinifilum caeruleilacunae]NOU59914.1 transcriptional repressor [Marinifilum caeruleilacunae]
MKQISKILQERDLVRTSCREEIIEAIVESPTPLSEEEIKTVISGNFDRTTLYRTFKTLLEKEVIHKIVIDKTLVKYAITEKLNRSKQHAHFYCLKCSEVYCIPEVNWDYKGLPDNYKPKQSELLIKGYCSNCN